MSDRFTPTTNDYDVAIIGGGPAGLSAVLKLNSAGKRSVVLDAGTPRNTHPTDAHRHLTRDRTAPHDLRSITQAEVGEYRLKNAVDWLTHIDTPAFSHLTGVRFTAQAATPRGALR